MEKQNDPHPRRREAMKIKECKKGCELIRISKSEYRSMQQRIDALESRISDLLEANNRYLGRAREAEALLDEALQVLGFYAKCIPKEKYNEFLGGLMPPGAMDAFDDGVRAKGFLAKIAARKGGE